jgi:hypothetical protein
VVDAMRVARGRDPEFRSELEAGIRNTLVFLSDQAARLEEFHLAKREAYQQTLVDVRQELAQQ